MSDVIINHWQRMFAAMAAQPWLSAISWICSIAAMHLGISASRKAQPLVRSYYFIFIIGINVIVALAMIFIGPLVAGLNWLGVQTAPLVAIGLAIVASYFFAYYSARRLRDIGWSPLWAWTLALDLLGYLLMLLLCLMPPTKGSETPRLRQAAVPTAKSGR